MRRFVEIATNPDCRLKSCQGRLAGMLGDPGREMDVIREFGTRKKIFDVHFRNIEVRFLHFQEIFSAEVSLDMIRAMRGGREVGYGGMTIPARVTVIAGHQCGRVAFAYYIWYVRVLIRLVIRESRPKAEQASPRQVSAGAQARHSVAWLQPPISLWALCL